MRLSSGELVGVDADAAAMYRQALDASFNGGQVGGAPDFSNVLVHDQPENTSPDVEQPVDTYPRFDQIVPRAENFAHLGMLVAAHAKVETAQPPVRRARRVRQY
jgi:hypothetical protein